MSGRLLITPRQLGPTMRMLRRRARSSIARCIAAPSSPSSSKPEEMTTAAGMPASAASARVASTAVAGTAITARSTGPGTSTRRGHAGTPPISVTVGWTACTVPVKPPATIERSTAAPTPVPSRRTPVTATLRGYSSGCSDRVSARHSRSSAASTAARRGCGVHLDVHVAGLRLAGHREAGVEEHRDHAVVVAEDLGHEAAPPAVASGRGEMLEQQAAEPEAVQGVVDEEARPRRPRDRRVRRCRARPRRRPARRPARGCRDRRPGARRTPPPPAGWG